MVRENGITNAGFIYFNWTSCKREAGSADRNCIGTRTRQVRFVNDTTGRILNKTVETEACNLTTSVIDGGYSAWTEWEDCSGNCNGKTNRSRTCHNPTPCNGGNDCQILGADTLEKQCGPVDGQWGSWESWETCINPNPDPWDIHGIGTHIRRRYCNDNAPICGGADCIGPDTDSENCTVITDLKILHYHWGFCEPEDGAKDQTCAGTRSRLVQLFNYRTREVLNKTTETEACSITLSVTDGGYTTWTAWADCSGDCNAMTSKTRICNNPTPCNGGKDCHDLGADRLEKQCGPVDGQWGTWGSWGSCSYPGSASIYGTGTHIRRRYCNETAPMCGGDDCIGPSSDSGNCRVVPPCLTPKILDERYLRKDSPMVIYTSARVEIYPLTRNNCTQSNILFNFWNLFLIDSTNGNETQIGDMTYTLNFRINSGAGLYRLYIKIGYPRNMLYWMEESMYIQIVHPPPHASIRGGDGRTIGKGLIDFDSSSVSYNLINGPGDPSGLTFQWKCLNFVTNSLYTLIKLNIDQLNAFNDQIKEEETKWYQTGFTTFVEEQVPWIDASVLYQRIKYYGNTYTNCSVADAFYVKIVFDNSTDSNVTTQQYFELVQLTQILNIKYIKDMQKNPNSTKDKTDVFPLPSYDTLVKNELLTFLDVLFDASELLSYTTNFYSMLSSSYLTLQSIMQLQHLDGLPPSADTNFFNDLTIWLKTAKRGIDISYQIQEVLETFDNYLKYVNHGLNLTDFIGIDGFILMSIDSSRNCWLDFLTEITGGFTEINSYDWFDMKEKERFYTDWIENELLNSSSCPGFVGSVNGTGSLNVSEVDVDTGMGYVLIVRVDFEGSVSYFTQFAQSVNGTPPLIEVECRFNCMKKTALTSIMSLKSSCPFCTVDQLRGAIFWWNVKDFDTLTRSAHDNKNWQQWMLSEENRRQFVMKADVLTANTGYLIEAYLQLSSGTVSMAIWSVTTNILPYGGSCEIENASRVEEENYITLKPGLEVDYYTIAVRVQIFDIFVDFSECAVDPGKVYPKYSAMVSSSISAYLTTAGENIDYYYNSGNVKQVAMNTEVAATSVTDLKLPVTIFDTDPSDWVNLGVETSSNGTVENLTFDDLWNKYENPDLGDVVANNEIMSVIISSFYNKI
ncbi:uncharacterized protein [Mytilus edulis]|uniref:uncharacterized protein n=1 Tax=Mytilus edulis TaxID=6550 RepID=UPI0039F07906